jgi:hypothetical protein
MAERDVLLAEVGAAFAILGLLLVFLPLFLESVKEAEGGVLSARERRLRLLRSWSVPATILLAALDATMGLLTLWGTCALAKPTGALLLGVTFCVVVLAAMAVWTTQ